MLLGEYDDRKFYLWLACITVIAFIVRGLGLGSQPLTADDIGVSASAMNYVENGRLAPVMWNHPHLRSLFVYAFMKIFGVNPWGIKAASYIIGSLCVPLIGLISVALFRDARAALLASFLLALDALHIDYSRQAINEIYMVFFALCAIGLAYLYRLRGGTFWLLLSGFCFGLGMASKWDVGPALGVTLCWLLYRTYKESASSRSDKAWETVLVCSSLGIVTIMVYAITFYPWFHSGYDMKEWWELQMMMLAESASHGGYNPYTLELTHKAYLWFVRPLGYADMAMGKGQPTILLGITNPLVWTLILPSVAWVIHKGIRDRDEMFLLVGALFVLSYSPYVLLRRPIWIHSSFSVFSYGLISLSLMLSRLSQKHPGRRKLLLAYLALVAIFSIPLYLLATGKGLDIDFLKEVVYMYEPTYESYR